MNQVFIDNDILIYLATGTYRDEDEILEHLEQLVDQGKIQLLVPDVLWDEWKRNKQSKVREALPKTLSNKIKTLRELKPYLKNEEYEVLNKTINDIQGQDTYYIDAIEKRITRIEALLNHQRTLRLPIIPDVKLKAAEMALNKQMPFKKDKNSMGDALNFLSCVEYQLGTTKPEVHFITNNKHDFGKEDNKSILHEDLDKVAKEKGVTVHYSIDIGEKLREFGVFIRPETKKIIKDILEYSTPEMGYNRYGLPAVIACCGETLSESAGIYINGNLFMRCKKCGHYYDSGVPFD